MADLPVYHVVRFSRIMKLIVVCGASLMYAGPNLPASALGSDDQHHGKKLRYAACEAPPPVGVVIRLGTCDAKDSFGHMIDGVWRRGIPFPQRSDTLRLDQSLSTVSHAACVECKAEGSYAVCHSQVRVDQMRSCFAGGALYSPGDIFCIRDFNTSAGQLKPAVSRRTKS